MSIDLAKPVLFLDLETTGQIDDRLPFVHPKQPHIVQLGWILAVSGQGIETEGHLLLDAGVAIPEAATKIHHITREQTVRFGINPKAALSIIYQLAKLAGSICMWDAEPQYAMLEATFDRLELRTHWAIIRGLPRTCVMDLARPMCKVFATQNIHDDKPLDLDFAHRLIVGYELLDYNHAGIDVRGCWRVFEQIQVLRRIGKVA